MEAWRLWKVGLTTIRDRNDSLMIEHRNKKHTTRKENIVWEWLEAGGWCHWKGVDVELEVRSREVCERRVGLDVSCKLSAPWLAILGGRVTSRSIRVRISLFLSSLQSTPSHFFSQFRSFFKFFPSSIFTDLSAIDRGRRRIVEIQRWTFFFFNFVFLFVSCFLQFWREIQLSQSKGIISDNLRLVPSFLFFSINDIFPEVFFSFFLRFRFVLFICRYSYFSLFLSS